MIIQTSQEMVSWFRYNPNFRRLSNFSSPFTFAPSTNRITSYNVCYTKLLRIDTDHPDLNVDIDRSRTFVTTERKPTVEDLNGHGTHVSGTIAAKNDDIGVVGVAAGATVISCRVV